jgi:Uma2 family endonuclease
VIEPVPHRFTVNEYQAMGRAGVFPDEQQLELLGGEIIDFYGAGHPRAEDVLLVIEVADTTGRWDRTVKRPLYSAAGLAEVWIVDVTAKVIEVALEPEVDGYRSNHQIRVGNAVSSGAFPDMTIAVAGLFA